MGPTLDPTVSMMTIVTVGDDRIIEQITKQLNKLVDVIKVIDLTENEYVERETALIRVNARAKDRAEALRVVDIFRAKIIHSTANTYTIEITGDVKKIDAVINLLRPLGIKDLIRTGPIAISCEEIKTDVAREERKVIST